MNDKHTIRLQPHSVGELMTEATRAYLHGGNVSALLVRLRDGVRAFILETSDHTESRMAEYLVGELTILAQQWERKEEEYYSQTVEEQPGSQRPTIPPPLPPIDLP